MLSHLLFLSCLLALVALNAPTASASLGHAARANLASSHRQMSRHHSTLVSRNSSSEWKLVTQAQGTNFFDHFTFYQGSDPTEGSNVYVSKTDAQSAGLISINSDENAVITVQKGSGISSRKSVRLSTKKTYTEGLFIVNAKHIPVGCGLWPAAWLLSANPKPSWPSGGEVDIIEGVNKMTENMFSLHTTSGCTASSVSSSGILGKFAMSDAEEARNCDASQTDDQGCGVISSTSGIYGEPYNSNGGGVHAFLWTSTELKMFFWKRSAIPSDITSGSPDPSGWGSPQASWAGDECEPDSYLWNMNLVINIALSGTWAGSSSVWSMEDYDGQTQSCKSITGKNSADDYLSGDPDLSEAYWEIEKVQIYQTTRKA